MMSSEGIRSLRQVPQENTIQGVDAQREYGLVGGFTKGIKSKMKMLRGNIDLEMGSPRQYNSRCICSEGIKCVLKRILFKM